MPSVPQAPPYLLQSALATACSLSGTIFQTLPFRHILDLEMPKKFPNALLREFLVYIQVHQEYTSLDFVPMWNTFKLEVCQRVQGLNISDAQIESDFTKLFNIISLVSHVNIKFNGVFTKGMVGEPDFIDLLESQDSIQPDRTPYDAVPHGPDDDNIIEELIAAMKNSEEIHDFPDTKPYAKDWVNMTDEDFRKLAIKTMYDINKMHAQEDFAHGLDREDRIKDILSLYKHCKGTVYGISRPSTYEDCLLHPRMMENRFVDNQKNNAKKKLDNRELNDRRDAEFRELHGHSPPPGRTRKRAAHAIAAEPQPDVAVADNSPPKQVSKRRKVNSPRSTKRPSPARSANRAAVVPTPVEAQNPENNVSQAIATALATPVRQGQAQNQAVLQAQIPVQQDNVNRPQLGLPVRNNANPGNNVPQNNARNQRLGQSIFRNQNQNQNASGSSSLNFQGQQSLGDPQRFQGQQASVQSMQYQQNPGNWQNFQGQQIGQNQGFSNGQNLGNMQAQQTSGYNQGFQGLRNIQNSQGQQIGHNQSQQPSHMQNHQISSYNSGFQNIQAPVQMQTAGAQQIGQNFQQQTHDNDSYYNHLLSQQLNNASCVDPQLAQHLFSGPGYGQNNAQPIQQNHFPGNSAQSLPFNRAINQSPALAQQRQLLDMVPEEPDSCNNYNDDGENQDSEDSEDEDGDNLFDMALDQEVDQSVNQIADNVAHATVTAVVTEETDNFNINALSEGLDSFFGLDAPGMNEASLPVEGDWESLFNLELAAGNPSASIPQDTTLQDATLQDIDLTSQALASGELQSILESIGYNDFDEWANMNSVKLGGDAEYEQQEFGQQKL